MQVMLRIFSDPRCLLHEVPGGFPERPERLARVLELFRRRGHELHGESTHAGAEEAILALHDRAYVRRFERAVEAGRHFLDSPDNPLSRSTWEAAKAAIEVTLAASDWLLEEAGRIALAAVRPPGHHAEQAMALGFCYFNNVAVAADYLNRQHGLERVAIVDFDVHHGNGTQHLFEERADVMYLSLHQHPFYPGTGEEHEKGKGAGEGTTVNVPLAAGCGDAQYAAAMQQVIVPAIRAFHPGALLVSAGFDAWRADPVGGMKVSEDGFREWGVWLGELAREVCDGRVLAVLEGGYDLQALPHLVLAHLEGLQGTGA
jgi:acetoin utilization deacetylase AcuC-like enzyme